MLLNELLAFFQAQSLGTLGTTLFGGSSAVLPPGNGPFLMCLEYAGAGAIRAMGSTVVAEQPRAQILAIAKTYAAARAKAEVAYRVCLHACDGGAVALSGATYLSLEPLQPPFDLGTDDNDRAVCAFNIAVQKKVSP